MHYGYLEVEGQHDAAFIARLLKLAHGLGRVQHDGNLDSYWKPLVPSTFPYDHDLLRRMPVPLFLRSPTHTVAIHVAVGDSRLAEGAEGSLRLLADEGHGLAGVGFVLDRDANATASTRLAGLAAALDALTDGWVFAVPELPGAVSAGKPRVGAFIMPDNAAPGTLEDVLLDCAALAYTSLLAKATCFVNSVVAPQDLPASDAEHELDAPAGRRKATVAAIGAVLRPGRAIQVSIQDNLWLAAPSLALPRVQALLGFLETLFELDPATRLHAD